MFIYSIDILKTSQSINKVTGMRVRGFENFQILHPAIKATLDCREREIRAKMCCIV